MRWLKIFVLGLVATIFIRITGEVMDSLRQDHGWDIPEPRVITGNRDG